jgi:hypothetical protein
MAMEAVRTPEMSVYSETTLRYILEGSNLHVKVCLWHVENTKGPLCDTPVLNVHLWCWQCFNLHIRKSVNKMVRLGYTEEKATNVQFVSSNNVICGEWW